MRREFRREVNEVLKSFSGRKLSPTEHRILWGIVSNKIWKVDSYKQRKAFSKHVQGRESLDEFTQD